MAQSYKKIGSWFCPCFRKLDSSMFLFLFFLLSSFILLSKISSKYSLPPQIALNQGHEAELLFLSCSMATTSDVILISSDVVSTSSDVISTNSYLSFLFDLHLPKKSPCQQEIAKDVFHVKKEIWTLSRIGITVFSIYRSYFHFPNIKDLYHRGERAIVRFYGL